MVNRMARFKYWLLSLLLVVPAFVAQPLWAAVSASLSRDQIYEGDTVVLEIETDGQSSAIPELDGLKTDFEVLSRSQSHRVNIVNGRRSEKRGWTIVLKPRRLGRLTVPAIPVGGEKTRPLTLEVKSIPPEVAKRMEEQLFVETEVEPGGHGPYVQQQLRLRVRLYYRVDLLDGELSSPAPNGDVVLERLGEDRHYVTTRAGKRYRVIERIYALFPQRSGTLQIPAVNFEGRAASDTGQRRAPRGGSLLQRFLERQGIPDPFSNDPFFNLDPFAGDPFTGTPLGDPGRRVSARSAPMTLEVKPRPKEFKGAAWLPAVELQVSDSWAESPPQFRVGEPVNRTLIVEAKGLESFQLPQIEMPALPGMQIYPEQPLSEDRVAGDWIVGRSEQTFSFVPTREGRQVVPEIRLRWWDVNADEERVVVLPRWEIDVEPGVAGGDSSAPPVEQALDSKREVPEKEAPSGNPVGQGGYMRRWPWMAMAVLISVLAVILAWRRQRRLAQRKGMEISHRATRRRMPGGDEALEDLHRACKANDPLAASHALLELARNEWPDDPPLDLTQLASRLVKGGDEIAELNRVLFSPHVQRAWDGRAICRRFGEGMAPLKKPDFTAKKRTDAMPLPPLYPPRIRHG
ncbi:MAG TPA: protein BatD [Chromatiales bacterium]|nr:protein BatD [Chromatiales bacterium]